MKAVDPSEGKLMTAAFVCAGSRKAVRIARNAVAMILLPGSAAKELLCFANKKFIYPSHKRRIFQNRAQRALIALLWKKSPVAAWRAAAETFDFALRTA